jgi:uncharacterized membrane protein HdeD (DUF308 family)
MLSRLRSATSKSHAKLTRRYDYGKSPQSIILRHDSGRCTLIQKLIKNWWLLVGCGLLHAIISVIYLIGQDTKGPLTFHSWHGTVMFLGKLTLAAGACTIAAAIWSSRRGKSWLLVLNGVACSAFGALLIFWRGPLAFRTIALLIVVMAVSIGIYELASAPTLRRHRTDEWLLGAAGVGSLGFALGFLAFVFRWIKLDPGSPGQTLLWLGSYFGFSAICMLGLALHLHRSGRSQSGQWEDLSPLGNPKHAH